MSLVQLTFLSSVPWGEGAADAASQTRQTLILRPSMAPYLQTSYSRYLVYRQAIHKPQHPQSIDNLWYLTHRQAIAPSPKTSYGSYSIDKLQHLVHRQSIAPSPQKSYDSQSIDQLWLLVHRLAKATSPQTSYSTQSIIENKLLRMVKSHSIAIELRTWTSFSTYSNDILWY